MWKKINLSLFILIYAICLFSCKKYLINFESFEITTNLPLSENWFCQEEILVDFSIEIYKPDNNNFSLLCDNKQIECNFIYENNLKVIPENGWELGKNYVFKINGDFYTIQGNSFHVQSDFHFTYGQYPDYLELTDFEYDSSKIKMIFNKEIQTEKLEKSIKILPGVDILILAEKDNKTVVIEAKNFFTPSTTFEITVDGLLAKDKWPLKNSIQKNFRTVEVTQLPEVKDIQKCELIDNKVQNVKQFEDKLEDFQTIEIIFNKPVDYFSFLENLSFTPAVDYYVQVPENIENCFVVIFREDFIKNKKYTLKISKNLVDTQNANMLQDFTKEFFPLKEYLDIQEIKINDSVVDYSENYSKIETSTETISISISFNKNTQTENITDFISLESFFPSTANIPVLTSARFSSNQDKIFLEYENFSKSTETKEFYYKLSISQDLGIEESKCVYFIIK